MSPDSIAIGLQEWQVCCDALCSGQITLIVRKGGIHEERGGLFTAKHRQFALLPTWLHQTGERVRPAYRSGICPPPSPGIIPVPGWCQVEALWRVDDRERLTALGDELLWTDDELSRRFGYRDEPWLMVLALRVWRFIEPCSIPDDPAYGGCRSWIPMTAPLMRAGTEPSLSDALFASRLATISARLTP